MADERADRKAERMARRQARRAEGGGPAATPAGGDAASFQFGKGLGGNIKGKQGARLQKLLARVSQDPQFAEIMGGAKDSRFGYGELEKLASSGLLSGDKAGALLGNLLGNRPGQEAPAPGGGGGGGYAEPQASIQRSAGGGGGRGRRNRNKNKGKGVYEDRIAELMERINQLENPEVKTEEGPVDVAPPPPDGGAGSGVNPGEGGPGWEPPPISPGGVWNWQKGDNMYQMLPPHVQQAMQKVWESFGIPGAMPGSGGEQAPPPGGAGSGVNPGDGEILGPPIRADGGPSHEYPPPPGGAGQGVAPPIDGPLGPPIREEPQPPPPTLGPPLTQPPIFQQPPTDKPPIYTMPPVQEPGGGMAIQPGGGPQFMPPQPISDREKWLNGTGGPRPPLPPQHQVLPPVNEPGGAGIKPIKPQPQILPVQPGPYNRKPPVKKPQPAIQPVQPQPGFSTAAGGAR